MLNSVPAIYKFFLGQPPLGQLSTHLVQEWHIHNDTGGLHCRQYWIRSTSLEVSSSLACARGEVLLYGQVIGIFGRVKGQLADRTSVIGSLLALSSGNHFARHHLVPKLHRSSLVISSRELGEQTMMPTSCRQRWVADGTVACSNL